MRSFKRFRFNRLLTAGLAAGAFVAVPAVHRAAAQSAATQVPVSATVIRNCTIQATPAAFGNYDPVGANVTQPLDSTATVTITCTRGTPATIEMDLGQNASGSTRRMTGGTTTFLNYELYQNATRTQVWGSGLTDRLDAGTAPSKVPRPFTVYGRVPAGQDVPAATFTDTVLATVNF